MKPRKVVALKQGDAVAMLDYERDMTLPQEEITKESLAGRMPLGVFRREVRAEYTAQYAALCARQNAGAGEVAS